jgi:ribosomal protein S15P/S13E
MATIAKFSIIEYGKNSELSQLIEGDCLRSDAKKLSPIKNLNCIMNEVNKLTTHFQNVDKDAFFRKYRRLMEIARVEVLSLVVRAIVHFWDPDYRCFSFGSIDLCPTMEEYGMLTEFPNNLYRIYLPLRSDKIIPELSKLLRISNLEKFLEKNATGLKWRILEIELEKKSGLEKERLIALGIFGLVLFQSQTGVVSLEAAAAYIEYENTQINPVAAILAETILTLNHCRRTGKGAMRCCTQLLYI